MTLGRVRREAAALYMKKKMNPLRIEMTKVAAIYKCFGMNLSVMKRSEKEGFD